MPNAIARQWDSQKTPPNTHLVLTNTISTDLFCSGASVMYDGTVLTTGGDLTVNGQRNFANNKTTIFTPSTITIGSNTPMQYSRWYLPANYSRSATLGRTTTPLGSTATKSILYFLFVGAYSEYGI